MRSYQDFAHPGIGSQSAVYLGLDERGGLSERECTRTSHNARIIAAIGYPRLAHLLRTFLELHTIRIHPVEEYFRNDITARFEEHAIENQTIFSVQFSIKCKTLQFVTEYREVDEMTKNKKSFTFQLFERHFWIKNFF